MTNSKRDRGARPSQASWPGLVNSWQVADGFADSTCTSAGLGDHRRWGCTEGRGPLQGHLENVEATITGWSRRHLQR
jgi:hypothetical protein